MHGRTYTSAEYEWDPEKAASNWVKHRVRFADACLALEDPLALTLADPDARGEERCVTLGLDGGGNLLVVVWSPRPRRIRLISARRATSWERRAYEAP